MIRRVALVYVILEDLIHYHLVLYTTWYHHKLAWHSLYI